MGQDSSYAGAYVVAANDCRLADFDTGNIGDRVQRTGGQNADLQLQVRGARACLASGGLTARERVRMTKVARARNLMVMGREIMRLEVMGIEYDQSLPIMVAVKRNLARGEHCLLRQAHSPQQNSKSGVTAEILEKRIDLQQRNFLPFSLFVGLVEPLKGFVFFADLGIVKCDLAGGIISCASLLLGFEVQLKSWFSKIRFLPLT